MLQIKQIVNIPNSDQYDKLKIEKGNEYIDGKQYTYELIDVLKYYFEDNELIYIKDTKQDKLYKVNNIEEVTNEEVFNLPLEYDIIDGESININSIID